MSYHYPQVQRDSADADLHAEYISGYRQPTTSAMEGTDDVDLGPLGLSGDKKRNKLGYHRSSMACVNCRKRKIRCLQDKNDVQGRCVTCIRLRKDCFYEPVDHGPAGNPAQAGPTALRIGQSMSSPSIASGHLPQPQTATMQSVGPPSSVKQEGHGDYAGSQNIHSTSAGYGQAVTNWVGPDTATTSPSSAKMSGGLSGESTWRQFSHESPVTPGFSPYAAHQPQTLPPHTSSGWPQAPLGAPAAGVSEASTRAEDTWSTYPQPVRSLSYSGEQASPYMHSRMPYERKTSVASDMYPPPITTNIEAMVSTPGTSAIGSHASLSAGALPSATYTTWQQPYQYHKNDEEYSGWYGEAGEHPGHGANMY